MRVDLEDLSQLAGRLELAAKHGVPQFVQIAALAGLRGVLVREPGRLALSSTAADQLDLREAQLSFGAILLRAAAELVLKRVQASFESQAGEIRLDLKAEQAQCGSLQLRTSSIALAGKVTMHTLALSEGDGRGTFDVGYLELTDLTLQAGETTLRAPHLVAHELRIGWGAPAGFTLTAKSARASDLTLRARELSLHAVSLACEGVALRGGALEVDSLTADRLDARAGELGAKAKRDTQPGGEQQSSAPRRYLDWSLLDELFGHLNADWLVDLTFAVMRRRATHTMRLEVDQGRIDYRELEHGLATLEDSLLDFSLRDNVLVLELGVPLLPTRGRGKRLVTWPLAPADVALAEARQVRLNVLARPELRSKPKAEPDEEESASLLQLHSVDVSDIDVELSLAPVRSFPDVVMRQLGFERLAMKGELHHQAEGESGPGRLVLTGTDLQLALRDLPLGNSLLAIAALRIGSIAELDLSLRGLQPRELSLRVEALSLERLALA